jgi:Triose-phosphate Transporter family
LSVEKLVCRASPLLEQLCWRDVQALLLDGSVKMSSLALLGHMAPASALLLLPMACYLEPMAFSTTLQLSAKNVTFAWLLLLNCLLSFFVNLTNFAVTQHCGALTLQVLGNAKGVIAAVVSVFIFRNPVSCVAGPPPSCALHYVGAPVAVFPYPNTTVCMHRNADVSQISAHMQIRRLAWLCNHNGGLCSVQ